MNDLIDRQKAYEILTEYYHHRTNVQHYALHEVLSKVPFAEPEWKKGKWIENHTTCSECGWQMIDDILESPNMVFFKYCPNCGADMRGE